MRYIHFLWLVGLMSTLPYFMIAQNLEVQVDKLYQVETSSPGFSVAVFQGDQVLLERQYGVANLDYDVPVNQETVFDVGSIGKQFTAAAILLLEEAGKLSIQDPAYQYIEDLPRYELGDPTIEQLLNQTSGIPEVDPYFGVVDLSWNDLLTQTRMMNIILNIPQLNFAPGTYFEYTNVNYVLLAQIVEQVSGQSFSDYLQASIFEPLGMDHTIKMNSTYSIVKDRAIGYIEDEGDFYKTHLHGAIYNGDGQISTTAADLFKWHSGIQKSTIGTPEMWAKMHTRGRLNDGTVTNFGLGVEFETHNGYNAMGFDGMIMGGFVSKYLFFPDLDMAFFTTQNTFDGDFRERFFQFVDLYIPKKEEQDKTIDNLEPKRVRLSDEQLKIYEGQYVFLGNKEEDIKSNSLKVSDQKLMAFTLDGDELFEFIPLGDHQFQANDVLVEFISLEGKKAFHYYSDENEQPWLFSEFQPYQHQEQELSAYTGDYYNKGLQLGKKLSVEGGSLYFHFRQGAAKMEVPSVSKDVFDFPACALEFVRNSKNEIVGFEMMGVFFEKL